MNTTNLKKYAPQARRDFMAAVSQRLNQLGIHTDSKGKLTISTPVVSGSVMQIEGLSFDAGLACAREKLAQRAEQMGFEALVEQMAYTWFNRLSAIRFMELHGYLEHNLRVLSPAHSQGVGWAEQREAQQNQTVGLHSIQPNLQVSTSAKGRVENTLPEILAHAQDVATDLGLDRNHIVELKLAGNKDEELYRTLLLGQCHQLQLAMPFLFEALDDETELLLPDNLTRTDSILRGLVDNIPENDWQPVEIIGWLYQFYISEKKDQVIGSVVKSEDIPAATQLFTPNWIVKYLVQNSVGRQWLMTYPDSGLKARMEYYIEPAEQEPSVVEALAAITPTSIDPETLKVLDPACGSGHILVEAYDILKAIYIERGYRVRDIPKLILEKNLYGLDIDDRAAQLAGFALMMKAREDDRRIFSRDIKLNVLAIQSTQHLFAAPQVRHSGRDCRNPDCMDSLELAIPGTGYPLPGGYDGLADLWRRLDLHNKRPRGSMESIFDDVQSNLADTMDDIDFKQLRAILALFEQAKTLGSLIQVPHEQAEFLQSLTNQLQKLAEQGDTMQKPAAMTLLPYVKQAWLLAEQYNAVVANPPYMGGKGMNATVKEFTKKQFPDSKTDLFSMFIERCKELGEKSAELAFVTPYVWMFISSYEKFREKLLKESTITTLIQLEYNAFEPACIPVCVFSIHNINIIDYIGSYIKLSEFKGHENQAPRTLEAIKNHNCEWFYNAKADDFNRIPGSPVAYWINDKLLNLFNAERIKDFFDIEFGIKTGNNDRFLRLWFEVSFQSIAHSSFSKDRVKWIRHNKGGEFRKWFGNLIYVLDWGSPGDLMNVSNEASPNKYPSYLHGGVSWSEITSSSFCTRYIENNVLSNNKGPIATTQNKSFLNKLLAYTNNIVYQNISHLINPTLTLPIGDFGKFPFPSNLDYKSCDCIVNSLIKISKDDWNSFETSWDFEGNPLLIYDFCLDSKDKNIQLNSSNNGSLIRTNKDKVIETAYLDWQKHNHRTILKMQELEIENNQFFIEACDLVNHFSFSVPIEQITLTINPKYRYGGNLSDEELDKRFQFDTLAELISYAIGCMMGRYSLDEPGLIYAHAGNIDFDVSRYASFPADEDGILPLTDQEWFKDDATNRFREFLLAVWGEDSLQQNLEFVAESLGLSSFKPKKGETSLDTVRRYLSNQFYKDHLQTYKKRPIYWLFSSGKQKAFECLVYLHRYNDSTLARMRTEYVTPLLGKYSAYADQLNQQLQDASSSEATRIKKDMLALEKKQTELRQFDDKLKHYADMRIKLDLDDGVKVNYGKFGDLLAEVKAVTGGMGD